MDHPSVTYASSHPFLSSPEWANIKHALLNTHLPLKNIHWKPASRPSLRTIQQVHVDLKPLDLGSRASVEQAGTASARPSNVGDQTGERSMLPESFLEKPFLNLFFVTCENVDTYKATVRKQIKDWHSFVVNRKNQEWVIVLIVKPDQANGLTRSTTGAGRLFKMGGSVLDKIRSDFNINKRDRCVQLSRPSFPTPDDPSLWTDLMAKIKEGIISAFDARVVQREEEIKSSEGMRTLPGWNFCTFFILKESLAHSFEGMNLYEDALMQYNELEASFFQVLKERNLSFFGPLGATAPNDDSSSILSTNTKPYRDFILANTISVFDFRVYMFARKAKLLARMGRLGEVLGKGLEFVRTVGRWLAENSEALAGNFVESWIYSSCMNLVDTCQDWKLTLPPNNTPSLSAVPTGEMLEKERVVVDHTAELYKLARVQLDKLGLQAGHLPPVYPFNIHSTSLSLSTTHPDRPITRRDLVGALENPGSFDGLFFGLTDKAIECLVRVGKERSTLELMAGLAALDSFRDRLPSAYERYRTLSTRIGPHGWTPTEAFYLIRTLDLHQRLSKQRDQAWVGRVLDLTKAVVKIGELGRLALWEEEDGKKGRRGKEEGLARFLEGCFEGLREAGNHLEKELPTYDHLAFSIKLPSLKSVEPPTETEDGCILKLIVSNHLPCTVVVDDVRACLSGHELEQLWFTAGKTKLKSGENIVSVFCPMPVSGLFVLETSQVRISKVVFLYTSSPSNRSDVSQRTVIRVPRDYKALNAKITMPSNLRLDSRPIVHLNLFSGRNHVTKGTVALKVLDDELGLLMKEAKVVSGEVATFSTEQDYVVVEGMDPQSTVVISIPYRGGPKGSSHPQIRISVDYWTRARPTQRRALRKTRRLDLSLPLSVNVHDIFREECLLSKFTIASGGTHYVRVASAQLVGVDDSLNIEGCQKDGANPIVRISPRQPGNFLYRLTQKDTSLKVHQPLQLTITYRTLDDELLHTIEEVVSPMLTSADVSELSAWLVKTMAAFVKTTPGWAARLLTEGTIDFPDADEGAIRKSCSRLVLDQDKMKVVLDVWQKTADILDEKVVVEAGPDMPWRTLQIPVDLPIRQVVSAVRLSISTNAPYRVGQPLKCVIRINCSSAWSGATSLEELPMCYDIGVDFEHWLVSGRRKGTFVIQENKAFSTTVTLIPVHSGHLSMPSIQVNPIDPSGSTSSETYLVNTAQSVEVWPITGRATFVIGLPSEPPNKHASWESTVSRPNGVAA